MMVMADSSTRFSVVVVVVVVVVVIVFLSCLFLFFNFLLKLLVPMLLVVVLSFLQHSCSLYYCSSMMSSFAPRVVRQHRLVPLWDYTVSRLLLVCVTMRDRVNPILFSAPFFDVPYLFAAVASWRSRFNFFSTHT